MAEVQWIKITTDMFDNKKIKYIRSLPEGNSIALIWVMLLTHAGRCNSNGFIFLTEKIPYTTSILANELGFNENIVIIALNALEQMNMIFRENTQIGICNWEEYQNIYGLEKIKEQSRKRVQKHREKQKLLQCSMSEDDNNVTCNVTVTHSNGIDKDKELDKDKEEEKKKNNNFETIWDAYPRKKEKSKAYKCFLTRLKEGYSQEDMLLAVNEYAKECKNNNTNEKYIKLPATFLGPNIPFSDYIRKENDNGRIGNDVEGNGRQDLDAAEEYIRRNKGIEGDELFDM